MHIAFVVLVDESAFGKDERTKVLIGRPDSGDLAIGRIELADFGDGALKLRADGLHEVALFADEARVIDAEGDGTSSGKTSDLRTGATAPDDDEVFPEGLHMAMLVLLKAKAETD